MNSPSRPASASRPRLAPRVAALAFLAVAASFATGCAYATGGAGSSGGGNSVGGARPSADPAKNALAELGVEGRSYVNDLGAVSSIHLKAVHGMGPDLLVEDIHGHLVYVDGKTLFARWEYRGMPAPFEYAPVATSTSVVGVSKGMLFALSRDAGLEEMAPKHLPVVSAASPVANDSTLFIPTYRTPSGNKTLQAVSLVSGSVGWGWRTAGELSNNLAIAGSVGSEVVYAVTDDGAAYGFSASPAMTRDVEPAWARSLHGEVATAPVADGDDLGIVMRDGRLVVLDRITGGTRIEGYPESGEKADGGAQFGSKHVFYAIGGELRAFDRATGAKAWSVKGANQFVCERGSRTIVRSPSGLLMSVDTKSGKLLGKKALPGWTFPARSAADSTLFGVHERGMLLSVESGW